MKTYAQRPADPVNTNIFRRQQQSSFTTLQRQPQQDPPGNTYTLPRYMPQPAAIDNTYVKKPLIQPLDFSWNPNPTAHEAGEMAQDVYNKYLGRTRIGNGEWVRMPGFMKMELVKNEVGFQSAVYYKQDPLTGKRSYVLSTAGTDLKEWQDYVADLSQPVGMSKQYTHSINIAQRLNMYIGSGQTLTFVGHSLGGGMAAANAMSTGRKAITFNAAGVSALTKMKHGLSSKNNQKNIKAFIIPGEMVDYYQGKIGSTADGKHIYVHPLLGKLNSLEAAVVKQTPQTIFVRGYLHTIGEMMSALEESGYK